MSANEPLGWTPFFQEQLEESDAALHPVRVIEEQRGSYRVQNMVNTWYAEASGRLRHDMTVSTDRPCVGDWVLARLPEGGPDSGTAVIQRVLNRRTCFSRQAPGETTEQQIIAANIDTVFLVQSLNHDFNPRRVERYLALLWESGASPVILLSKSDLCDDPAEFEAEIRSVAPGVPCHTVSALESTGLEALDAYLVPGQTIALVGSSGVGKSTLLNRLAGEELARVSEIREDGRGRHTTTSRHLFVLPSGALLLDTPGMRTVILWEGDEGIGKIFDDIDALALECRFGDCGHESEPGCAVRGAVDSGQLDAGRLKSYFKLQREARFHARKTDVRLRIEEQKKWKKIHLQAQQRPDKRKMR